MPAAADLQSLRLAIQDLMDSFPQSYTRGTEFLARLSTLEQAPSDRPEQRKVSMSV